MKILKVHFVTPVVVLNDKYLSLPKHGSTEELAIEEADTYVMFPTLGLKVFNTNIVCITYEVPKPVEEPVKLTPAERMAKARAAKKEKAVEVDVSPDSIGARG